MSNARAGAANRNHRLKWCKKLGSVTMVRGALCPRQTIAGNRSRMTCLLIRHGREVTMSENSTLYVTRPGATLRKQGGRLLVEATRGQTIAAVPLGTLQRIVLVGSVMITPAAIKQCLKQGISITFLGRGGMTPAVLSGGGDNVILLLDQVRCIHDPAYRLAIAREIVRSKISGQRAILGRHARTYDVKSLYEVVSAIDRALEHVEEAADLEELRGLEGHAAHVYFQALKMCIRVADIAFTGRNRRPPRDPMNALLSLGYMLLVAEVAIAVAGQGLNPGLGLLHEVSERHPSLVLDLVEPFRQRVSDRLALALINRRVLGPSDFKDLPSGGVSLVEDALSVYLSTFDRMVTTGFAMPDTGTRTTYRELIRSTAQDLKYAVRAGTIWKPALPKEYTGNAICSGIRCRQ